MKEWSPLIAEDQKLPRRSATGNVHRLLKDIVADFGAARAAKFLDVDRSMITRWTRGEAISSEMKRRILATHAVLARAQQIMQPEIVMDWLVGSNQHLSGGRPIDALAILGPAPVLEALDAFEDLAYA